MTANQNTGHGHVYPRPDGIKARCGGPKICSECARDFAQQQLESPTSTPLRGRTAPPRGTEDNPMTPTPS